MNAIEIRDLTKSFHGMHAVDHLNMTVPVGAIYGFIGENGSGKSTTETDMRTSRPKSRNYQAVRQAIHRPGRSRTSWCAD